MTKPFVGLPTEGWGCAFSAAVDIQACEAAPDVHLAVQTPGWGLVSLTSCDRHAVVARATGIVIAEHLFGAACPPGTCWDGEP